MGPPTYFYMEVERHCRKKKSENVRVKKGGEAPPANKNAQKKKIFHLERSAL